MDVNRELRGLHGPKVKGRQPLAVRLPLSVHPLQSNGLMNMWTNIIKESVPLEEQARFPVAIPEAVVLSDNEVGSWYRWDDDSQRIVFKEKFAEKVKMRKKADGQVEEDWDWEGNDDEDEESEDDEAMFDDDIHDTQSITSSSASDKTAGSTAIQGTLTQSYTQDDDDKARNQMSLLLRRFSKRAPGEENLDVCAVFLGDDSEPHNERAGTKNVTVEFMDKPKLKKFLEKKKPNGVLQKFIFPQVGHMTLIQAIWTPYVMIVERRQNLYRIRDTSIPLYYRTVTSTMDQSLSREVPVQSYIEKQLEAFFAFMSNFLAIRDQMHLYRCVSYFTVREDGTLFLMWCSSFELVNAVTPLPHYTHKLKAQVMRMQQLFNCGENFSTVISKDQAEEKRQKKQSKLGASLSSSRAIGSSIGATSPGKSDPGQSPSKSDPGLRGPDFLPHSRSHMLGTSLDHTHPNFEPLHVRRNRLYRPPKVTPKSQSMPDYPQRFVTPYDNEKPIFYRELKERQKARELKKLRMLEDKEKRMVESWSNVDTSTRQPNRPKSEANVHMDFPSMNKMPRNHSYSTLSPTSVVKHVDTILSRKGGNVAAIEDVLQKSRIQARREMGWNSSPGPAGLLATRVPPEKAKTRSRKASPPHVCSRCIEKPEVVLNESTDTKSQMSKDSKSYFHEDESSIQASAIVDGLSVDPDRPLTQESESIDLEKLGLTPQETMEMGGATSIQTAWRGYTARKRVRTMKDEKTAEEEYLRKVVKIQTSMRQYHARKEVRRLKRQYAKKGHIKERRKKGAIKIQAMIRGYQARKKARRMRRKREQDIYNKKMSHISITNLPLTNFHSTISEQQRKCKTKQRYAGLLDMLFAEEEGEAKHFDGKIQKRRAEAKQKEQEEEAAMRKQQFDLAQVSDQWKQVNKVRSQYVAIEAKYNNQIATDFIEDILYQAYSHALYHRDEPFRFSIPAEYGALRLELDSMLTGFGVEREEEERPDTSTTATDSRPMSQESTKSKSSKKSKNGEDEARAASSEEKEKKKKKDRSKQLTEDEIEQQVIDGALDMESQIDDDDEGDDDTKAVEQQASALKERELRTSYNYVISGEKVVLAQLSSDLEALKDFVNQIFQDENPTTMQRLKEGVESGRMTFYEVIMNVKAAKEQEEIKKRKVKNQIEAERKRMQSGGARGGIRRLGGVAMTVGLRPLAMAMDYTDNDDDFLEGL